MPSKNAKSGGKRATERKRRAQDAVRPDGYDQRAIAAFKRLRRRELNAAGALDEALDVLRLSMRQALTDPGMPPEYRREQGARIAAQLVKAADPKRLIDELRSEFIELEEAVEKLRAHRAAQELPRAPSEPAQG